MTLLFIDSFDHYTTADITAKWSAKTGSPTISAAGGLRGGGALYCVSTGSTQNYLNKTFSANQSTVIFGLAIYETAAWDAISNLVVFRDATTDQITIGLNAAGNIVVLRGSRSGGTVLGTTVNALSLNTWYYLEVKVKFSQTVGTVEIRINTTPWLVLPVIPGAALDTCVTVNEYVISFLMGGIYRLTCYIDDLYICNTDGATNNTFLGPIRVDAQRPNGNGTYSQMVNSNGNSTNNYTYVDDTVPDGDTTYVQSGVVGNKDSYTITPITHTPLTIFGAQINLNAKKDDATARSIAGFVRSGGVDSPGTAQVLTTSYVNYVEIRETNPDGGAAWDKATFNAAEFGPTVAA